MTIDRRIGFILLSSGALGVLFSVLYESAVVAFIGLTLTFWGCLFLLVLPGKYVETEVMDKMASSSLSAVDQIIADSNVQGKPVYVPVPRGAYLPYYMGSKNEFVYIPRRNVSIDAAMEEVFMKNPKGLRITPLGLGLANLMEIKSKLEFHNLDVESLMEALRHIITLDLRIADDFEMRLEGNEVRTEIRKPLCEDLCKETSKMRYICSNVGCPICSSIACILTRVTNKPITIERCILRYNIIETVFHILKD